MRRSATRSTTPRCDLTHRTRKAGRLGSECNAWRSQLCFGERDEHARRSGPTERLDSGVEEALDFVDNELAESLGFRDAVGNGGAAAHLGDLAGGTENAVDARAAVIAEPFARRLAVNKRLGSMPACGRDRRGSRRLTASSLTVGDVASRAGLRGCSGGLASQAEKPLSL